MKIEAGKPGPEHDRLRRELESWAISKGFSKEEPNLPSGKIPDVVRYTLNGESLFIGDAKDSENETSDDEKTHSQIKSYFGEFASLVSEDKIEGGIIAIATNSKETASDWKLSLNTTLAANFSGSLDFQILEKSKRTWIIYWSLG